MRAQADVARFVAHTSLLRRFSADVRQRLLEASRIQTLKSGQVLYDAGSPPEYLYVVVNGRLRAEHFEPGEPAARREIGRGESVGGISILSGRAHKARIVAIRDTRVLSVPAAVFVQAFDAEPVAGRAVLHRWLNRFLERRSEARARLSVGSLRTVAVVGAHPGAPVEAVARGIARVLSSLNLCLRLDRQRVTQQFGAAVDAGAAAGGEDALSYWLDEQEQRHRYLVLQADPVLGEWTERCLRQADRVIVVVDTAASAQPSALTRRLLDRRQQTEVEVALVGAADGQPMAWRELTGARFQHRLRRCEQAEFERIGRLLTGRAHGLALGGGGARGFAHVGLIEAMAELGMTVDLVYGTSMGAFIGGLLASGREPAEIRELAIDTWVRRNLLNDYTVPRVSLIKARKARRHMEALFGETRIEDLPIHYGCVSTNLNKGTAEVHTHGRLAHWIGTSMSVPGIAPPVVYRGDLLVDGGVVAPVPVEQVADLARGPVIAADVTSEENFRGVERIEETPEQLKRRRSPEDTNIFQILFRAATLSTPQEFQRRRERADCYLRMPVAGVGMFDWDRAESLIEASREYALRELGAWLQAQQHGA